jgi:anti-anti-sigma regulatory factor
VQTDHDAKLSPLAWLALFDLLQRAGDRAAFDQHALAYSLQFERSAPPWEGAAAAAPGPKVAPAGIIVVTGKLAAGSASQIDGIRRAVARKVAHARLDFGGVTGFDDAGARLLADALAEARRARLALAFERGQKLVAALDAAVRKGREGGEGAWLLSLELLQWTHAQAAFDERAIEYAVTFEMSPPSWEPPPAAAAPVPTGAAGADAEAVVEPVAEGEQLAFTGTITGSALQHVARLTEFAQHRAVVPVDLSGVDRIDFVCAGALANGINRVETQRKSVQIVGATPIIRALLLLIGISPRHFVVKKSA